MSHQPTPPLATGLADREAERVIRTADARLDPAEAVSRSETIPLMEEALHVGKREVVTGAVRVSTRTETTETTADITLERTVADVTRVQVGRLVEEPPTVRTEGDTTIVPVFEERYVVVKQLYLTEELHIRHRVEPVVSHTPVRLRRQTAIVERLDADGRILPDDTDAT